MDFLEEFDERAKNPPAPDTGSLPAEEQELLNFADLIRSRQAAPSADERARILTRVINAGAKLPAPRAKSGHSFWWAYAAAALLMVALGLGALMPSGPVTPTVAPIATTAATQVKDDFANAEFPHPVLAAPVENSAAEVPSANNLARALRVHGLVVYQTQ